MSGSYFLDSNVLIYTFDARAPAKKAAAQALVEKALAELYRSTLALAERWRYSFFDSLILAAALAGGCQTVYTEDLQHGQEIEGLRIVNPFNPSA